jgi:hypothetical protein
MRMFIKGGKSMSIREQLVKILVNLGHKLKEMHKSEVIILNVQLLLTAVP